MAGTKNLCLVIGLKLPILNIGSDPLFGGVSETLIIAASVNTSGQKVGEYVVIGINTSTTLESPSLKVKG